MRNSRSARMGESPASQARAEAVAQCRLTEVAAVGPQAEQVVLPTAGDAQTNLEFGMAHAQFGEGNRSDVCVQKVVDGVGRIACVRLQLELSPASMSGVAQMQGFHEDEF